MKKVSGLPFRFHIGLILILYVGVAGCVVWQLPVPMGHAVMIGLALWAFVVAWKFPRHHRLKQYKDSTPELEAKIEWSCKAICIVLSLIIMAHAAIVGIGWMDVFGYYVAEAIALIVLIFVLLMSESDTEEQTHA